MRHEIKRLLGKLAANDGWDRDVQFHPSDWERGIDCQDKFRERRDSVIRAFDSAMTAMGRDRELAAERLGFIAATMLCAGEQLGLDMTERLAFHADLMDDDPSVGDVVKSVLPELDRMAHRMGDEGVFRSCRDRLRAALAREE